MHDDIKQRIEVYQRERETLGFLDSNLWIGRPPTPGFVSGFNFPGLRRRMDRYRIQGGVVSHFACIDYGQSWGNESVLRAIEGTGLWAGIVLTPESFYDEETGRAGLSDMIERGARMARLYPKDHHFSIGSWCSGAMLQALSDSRMPLMVRHTQVSWEGIAHICHEYPRLPLIVEAVEQKILYHNRRFYPLMERYGNLCLELHNFVAYLALEDIVHQFGAERLIFGSYLPVNDPNAAMMLVTNARISGNEKKLIARQNLLNLVESVLAP